MKTHRTDRQVEVICTDIDSVRTSVSLPALAILKLTRHVSNREPRYAQKWHWTIGVSHAVVLFGFPTQNQVAIGDPRFGRETWNLQGFCDLWQGELICLTQHLSYTAEEYLKDLENDACLSTFTFFRSNGVPAAVPVVMRTFEETDSIHVRTGILHSLSLGAASQGRAEDLIPILERGLVDESPQVRQHASSALVVLPKARALLLLERLTGHSNTGVAAHARATIPQLQSAASTEQSATD